MAQMAIGHQQVVIADAGLLTLVGGPIDRHAFTDGVVIADHHLRGGTLVFEILGLLAEAGPRKDLVVLSDDESTIEHRVGPDPGV